MHPKRPHRAFAKSPPLVLSQVWQCGSTATKTEVRSLLTGWLHSRASAFSSLFAKNNIATMEY